MFFVSEISRSGSQERQEIASLLGADTSSHIGHTRYHQTYLHFRFWGFSLAAQMALGTEQNASFGLQTVINFQNPNLQYKIEEQLKQAI